MFKIKKLKSFFLKHGNHSNLCFPMTWALKLNSHISGGSFYGYLMLGSNCKVWEMSQMSLTWNHEISVWGLKVLCSPTITASFCSVVLPRFLSIGIKAFYQHCLPKTRRRASAPLAWWVSGLLTVVGH